jgi:hypothetical protein
MRPAGGNHRLFKEWVERWEIPTDHFDAGASARRVPPRTARPLDEVLVQGSTYSRNKLKQRLYLEGLKERRCEMCGQDEDWRGRTMSLILDHINGVPDDNRLENLRIVCPNCAATLDTHCGRKNRREPEIRTASDVEKSSRLNIAITATAPIHADVGGIGCDCAANQSLGSGESVARPTSSSSPRSRQPTTAPSAANMASPTTPSASG